jgi:hypothetical protein
MMLKSTLLLLLAPLLVAVPVVRSAELDSKTLAMMSRTSWAAFLCVGLADQYSNETESRRLFAYAYNQGKIFLDARSAGEIEPGDVFSLTPGGFFFLIKDGQSSDFILGRLYQEQLQMAENLAWHAEGRSLSEREMKKRAETQFTERNCEAMGR